MLEDDTHWESTLYESVLYCSAKSLRYLFVKSLVHILLWWVLVKSMEELAEKVHPDISNISTKTLNWFQERVILSPSNEQIDEIKILLFQNLKLHHKPITQLTQSWIERRQYIIQLNS